MLANMVMQERIFNKSFRNSLINGLLSGLLGGVLMIYGAEIAPGIMIDFRFIPIILMGLYVSLTAAVETAVIIGVLRIAQTGLNRVTFTAFFVAMIIGVGSGLIGKTKFEVSIKWLASVVLVCVAAGIGIFSVTAQLENRFDILNVYVSTMVIVSTLMFFITEYVVAFNRKFEKIKDEAEKDFLTGLNNPRQFYKSLNRYFEVEDIDQKHVSLLYIDVDHFKKINDTFGHDCGDLVLKDLGEIFRQTARNHDIISRKGGEEFAILLVDCNEHQAVNAAERIRKAVETHDFKLSSHQTAKVTISIGISSIPEKTTTVNEMIEQADKALYCAKNSGRNRVMLAS